MSTLGSGGFSIPFEIDLSPTPVALQIAAGQTSPDKNVNCPCTTAPFTPFLGPSGFVVLCQLTQESRPSMTFLSVGSQVCRWLPPDPPSRERPCLKLVVLVTRIIGLIIWTVVLLQGTFTPLVHAHARRTQSKCIGTPQADWLSCKGYLRPVSLVVRRSSNLHCLGLTSV